VPDNEESRTKTTAQRTPARLERGRSKRHEDSELPSGAEARTTLLSLVSETPTRQVNTSLASRIAALGFLSLFLALGLSPLLLFYLFLF